jgi:hypothetical protein
MNQTLTENRGKIRPTDWNSGATCRAIAKVLRGVGLFVATLVLVGSLPAFAQLSSSGTINGTVKDSSGAIIPGATVSVQNQGTQRVTTRPL